ncbi:sialin-like [Periplaneta americana]|uniref:sialin-like n=1 Tax=Periplaneta americana TaxID=6978 RepID=UPI0037E8E23A
MAGCTVSARDILWYLVFTGFAVNYMVRLNINIGIVSMVKSTPKSSNVSNSNACTQTVVSNSSINSTISMIHIADESRFLWDEKQQGLVLGAFFWLFWLTQVPGGMLAQRYGTKLIFGLSNAVPCVMACLIPLCARIDYRVLVFLRVLQGLIAGLSWPSMHHLAANWIPPNERSKFVTAYMGGSVGAAITYPFCGLLINWFDWPSVFHATGAIGTLWFICWWYFVYDSPAQHPRISETEKKDILKKLGQTVSSKRLPIPWKEVLLSRPMWMNIIAQWGNIWGLFTLITQSPTYFKYIHGWDIRMAGLLSGIPHLARIGFAIIISFIGDYLLKKNSMSRTNVRKMATAFCCLGQGLFTLGLAFADCNSTVAIVCLTLATGLSGAVSTGALASFIDISPNFASIMLGISSMVSVVPGFISPIIVGHLTYKNQTVGQWQLVFIIATINLLVPGILYQFFSSSDLQPWNSPKEENHSEELQKLHSQQNKDDIVTKDALPYMTQKETKLKAEE